MDLKEGYNMTLIAIISALCIKTSQVMDKEQKIACISYYTNCIINTDGNVTKCKNERQKDYGTDNNISTQGN